MVWQPSVLHLLLAGTMLGPGAGTAQDPGSSADRFEERAGTRSSASRIRPGDEVVARIVSDGVRRSPTFRALVRAIQETDVIVYVHRTLQPRHLTAGRVAAGMTFLCATATTRFLRVTLAAGNLHDTQIEALGHEFQHVLEVAGATDVRSKEEFRVLYKRIGMSVRGPGYNETAAAVRVSELIWGELHGGVARVLASARPPSAPDPFPPWR